MCRRSCPPCRVSQLYNVSVSSLAYQLCVLDEDPPRRAACAWQCGCPCRSHRGCPIVTRVYTPQLYESLAACPDTDLAACSGAVLECSGGVRGLRLAFQTYVISSVLTGR